MNNFKKWIKCAGVRALKTIAQTAAGSITVGAMISDLDWKTIISISIVSGIYSILTSIAGIPEVKEGE